MADKFAIVEFEEYPGQEFRVRLSSVPLSQYEAIADAFVMVGRQPLPEHTRTLREEFGPLYDGDLADLELPLVLALVREWIREVRTVPLPLRVRSSDGVPSADPEAD